MADKDDFNKIIPEKSFLHQPLLYSSPTICFDLVKLCHGNLTHSNLHNAFVKSLYATKSLNQVNVSSSVRNGKQRMKMLPQFISESSACLWLMKRTFPTAHCSCSSNETDSLVSERSPAVGDEDDSLPGVRLNRRQRESVHTSQHDEVSVVELNNWIERETGMDRLQQAYSLGHDGFFAHEDTRNLCTMLYRTVLIGFVVNVFTASQSQGKKEKYLSRTEAALKGSMADRALPRQVMRSALKSTLHLTVCATILYHLPHTIASYRNKTTTWEFVFSSAVAFGMLGVGRDARGFLSCIAGGTVIGLIGGYITTNILMHNSLTQEQRHLERVKQYIKHSRTHEGSDVETV